MKNKLLKTASALILCLVMLSSMCVYTLAVSELPSPTAEFYNVVVNYLEQDTNIPLIDSYKSPLIPSGTPYNVINRIFEFIAVADGGSLSSGRYDRVRIEGELEGTHNGSGTVVINVYYEMEVVVPYTTAADTTQAITPDTADSPQTGSPDNGSLWMILIAVCVATSLVVFASRRKKAGQ